ncbi:hypothetical protein GR254_03965 [Mycobacterium tuberculosis]|nr:hypothetical protein [Mycobacterium tuberculosis]
MTIPHEGGSTGILVLRDDDHDDVLVLDRLRSDPSIEFVDRFAEQLAGVRRLLPQPDPDLLEEAKRWAYYPWRRMVVAILGLRGFRAVRLDRNRHLITAEEQRALHALRVGVVGLSAGHAIAYTLAAEGACGTLRLADFDKIELSNLNRVPVGVFDIGLNKAMIAARRIAELDPYLAVDLVTSGLSPESVDEFLDGLDVVIEECDSLDIKVILRQAACARGVPVLMATSDRGLVDELGGLRTAVRRAKVLAGLDEDTEVRIVSYPGSSLWDMVRPRPSSRPAAASLPDAMGALLARSIVGIVEQVEQTLSGASVLWLGESRL